MKRRTVTRMHWLEHGTKTLTNVVASSKNWQERTLQERYILDCIIITSHGGGKGEASFSISHPWYDTENRSDTRDCEWGAIKDIVESLYNYSATAFTSLDVDRNIANRSHLFNIHFKAQPGEPFCEVALRVALSIIRAFGVESAVTRASEFRLDQETEVRVGNEWWGYDTFLQHKFLSEHANHDQTPHVKT